MEIQATSTAAIPREVKRAEFEMCVIRANGLVEPLGIHGFGSKSSIARVWWSIKQRIKRRLPVRFRNWLLLRRMSPELRAEVNKQVQLKLAQSKEKS